MDDPVWECQYILQEPGSLAQKEGGEEVFPGSVEAGGKGICSVTNTSRWTGR